MFDLGRSRLPRSRSKTALSVALALTFAASTLLFADDDESAPHQGRPPLHVQETMRAFQNDQLAPENLAAQSITSCTGGFAGSYACSNVDLMAFLPLNQIGGGFGNDIWGWTDPQTGKEYAIMGRTTGDFVRRHQRPGEPGLSRQFGPARKHLFVDVARHQSLRRPRFRRQRGQQQRDAGLRPDAVAQRRVAAGHVHRDCLVQRLSAGAQYRDQRRQRFRLRRGDEQLFGRPSTW